MICKRRCGLNNVEASMQCLCADVIFTRTARKPPEDENSLFFFFCCFFFCGGRGGGGRRGYYRCIGTVQYIVYLDMGDSRYIQLQHNSMS